MTKNLPAHRDLLERQRANLTREIAALQLGARRSAMEQHLRGIDEQIARLDTSDKYPAASTAPRIAP